MRFEYCDFCLNISSNTNPIYAICPEANFSYLGNSYDEAISNFKYHVDNRIGNENEYYYKGYILELGWIADHIGQKRLGGHCKELDYKTYGEDNEVSIAAFKKYINWKISEEKKQRVPNNLESIEKKLDKLIELLEKKEKPKINPFPEYSSSGSSF
jgi:hypothetical protein